MATYCYDANDNQTVVAPPRASGQACSLDGGDGHSVKTSYDERDMVSQVLTKTDGKIAKSTHTYNAASHTKRIEQPDGSWVQYLYDRRLDRLVMRQDPGGTTLWFYDCLGSQIVPSRPISSDTPPPAT